VAGALAGAGEELAQILYFANSKEYLAACSLKKKKFISSS
jgi:hypothetical protein